MEYRLQSWVSGCVQNNNHQAVKTMEWIENRKYEKIQKPLGFRLCVYVWAYVGGCVFVYVL